MLEQIFFDRSCGLWRAHAGVEEKGEKEGVEERNQCVPVVTPIPLCHFGLGREVCTGVKLSLGKVGRKGGVLIVVFLFLAP